MESNILANPVVAGQPFAGAKAPQRERGRLRVAAIMQAATQVFTEKGYDGATMTEIAARSDTAIGSLYRFFPSKDALADALLLRHAQHVTDGFAELEQQVPAMTSDNVAGALVDFMLAMQTRRAFAVSLLDARGGSDDKRALLRQALRSGIASILRKTVPGLTDARARVMAVMLVQVFKGVTGAAQEQPAVQAMLLAEMRELVHVYLAAARARAG